MENVITSGQIVSEFGGTITARNSIVGNLVPVAGTQVFVNTQVLGINTGSSSATCIFSYDATFQPLGPNCL